MFHIRQEVRPRIVEMVATISLIEPDVSFELLESAGAESGIGELGSVFSGFSIELDYGMLLKSIFCASELAEPVWPIWYHDL